jgi:hypothetical protein
MDTPASFVPDKLRDLANLYEERNVTYGDNYKRFGPMAAMMFPNGLIIRSADDWNRLALFIHVMTKVTRYANLFDKNGHSDSLDDLAVYAMMMREIDGEIAVKELARQAATEGKKEKAK